MKINNTLYEKLSALNEKAILDAFQNNNDITNCYKQLFNINDKKDLSGSTIYTLRAFLKEKGLEYKNPKEIYKNNPLYCKQCGKQLTYRQYLDKQVFCSKTCSATYNNKYRKISEETITKLKSTLKEKFAHLYTECYCKDCGKFIGNFLKSKPKVYCDDCAEKYSTAVKAKVINEEFEKWKRNEEGNFSVSDTNSTSYGELKHSMKSRIKTFLLEEQQHKCAICGCSDEWNSKKLILVLDHKDGNWQNQIKNNLRMICPNCNSQLDTTKHKEKGTGRYSKRLEYKKFKNKLDCL